MSGPISEEKVNVRGTSSSQIMEVQGSANASMAPPPPNASMAPPPPVYFTGYKLPPGNPCEHFTLPPPPADKKRTGPRRKFSSPFVLLRIGINPLGRRYNVILTYQFMTPFVDSCCLFLQHALYATCLWKTLLL